MNDFRSAIFFDVRPSSTTTFGMMQPKDALLEVRAAVCSTMLGLAGGVEDAVDGRPPEPPGVAPHNPRPTPLHGGVGESAPGASLRDALALPPPPSRVRA